MPRKVIFGGLTSAHDTLVEGAFKSFGLDAESLPEPDNEALRLGKIYCNKGQCNPVYYTAGNILKYLFSIQKRGEKDLENKYLFITAGSCGPCRFGMYEIEYRKAVRDAGFKDFKILALQQDHALLNELKGMGFDLPRKSLRRVLKSFILADLINSIYYKTKPYEVLAGSIDRWRKESLDILYDALSRRNSIRKALLSVYEKLDKLTLDYFRPKPKVKITGEFFSQMQEGEANYRLPGWLIEEGAEPIVEPITTWLEYLLWGKIRFTWERAFRIPAKAFKSILIFTLIKLYIQQYYKFYRRILGKKPDLPAGQKSLARYARQYFSPKLVGGEGHLEVGKHIYTIRNQKAHMVISVKPFGCMCSTQSDGVQIKAALDTGNSIFISVDTSGDAEVNFKSRILMKLYEAKQKVADEYEKVLQLYKLKGKDVERLKKENPSLTRGSLNIRGKGVSTAVKALLSMIS